MLRTRKSVAIAASALVLAMSGTAAASASTHGRVAVTSNVTNPNTVSLTVTTQVISFAGQSGDTEKAQVYWSASSTDPNGFSVTVQTGSNNFTDGRSSFPVGAGGWQLTNTDAASTGGTVTPNNMSTTPLTVFSTPNSDASPYNGEDFYKATIPANAPMGDYFIPGGLFYVAIGN